MPGNGLSGHKWEQARTLVFRSQTICGICGEPVDQSLKWPHPKSRTVDHIVARDRGGDPYNPANLQLAHADCNRRKWDGVRQNNPSSRTWLKGGGPPPPPHVPGA